MFQNIREDIKVVCNQKRIGCYLKIVFFSHTVHLIMLYRLGCFFQKRIPIAGGVLSFLIEYLIRVLYASDISCKASIGRGFNIAHGHDIVIGSNVIIGNYCKIFNGVTLGNKYTETNVVEQPLLEDNVIISTGAKILGSIKIGRGSVIGANSVVINNVPQNSIVVGVPGRIIESIDSNTDI
jgi:serine O-acetyltransferase